MKIYETDPCFYEHFKRLIKVDKNGHDYILFKTDIYFFKYKLAVEIDGKVHTGRDLIFEEKRQETLEKKLNCEFIRINISKEGYDANYEIGTIQRFISKFKNRQFRILEKESNKKVKELAAKIEKLKLQLTS